MYTVRPRRWDYCPQCDSFYFISFCLNFRNRKGEEKEEKKKIYQNQCEITHHPRVRQEATVQGHTILGAGITE